MDNISLLLGNGCSLLATLSNMFASTRKTGRGVLMVQSVGQAFYFACARDWTPTWRPPDG